MSPEQAPARSRTATRAAGFGLAALFAFWTTAHSQTPPAAGAPAAAPAAAVPATGAPAPASAQTPAPAAAADLPPLQMFESGREQFHRTCAQCHGRNMVNAGTTVYDLRKFPQDQPERFFQSVTNGKGNMPSFREALSEDQKKWLWTYISNRGKAPQ